MARDGRESKEKAGNPAFLWNHAWRIDEVAIRPPDLAPLLTRSSLKIKIQSDPESRATPRADPLIAFPVSPSPIASPLPGEENARDPTCRPRLWCAHRGRHSSSKKRHRRGKWR